MCEHARGQSVADIMHCNGTPDHVASCSINSGFFPPILASVGLAQARLNTHEMSKGLIQTHCFWHVLICRRNACSAIDQSLTFHGKV